MANLTCPRPRVKAARKANVTALSPVSGERILTLAEGEGEKEKRTHFYLTEERCDFGRGFRLEKFGAEGGDTYHVNLSAEGNRCECLGHLRHGHRTVCRHVAALTNLTEAGKL